MKDDLVAIYYLDPSSIIVKPMKKAFCGSSLTAIYLLIISALFGLSLIHISFTGDGPWTFRFNNGQRDSLITTSVTPYVIEVKPGATTIYTLSTVSNQCGVGRVFGTARIQVDPILAIEPAFSSTWLKVYPVPVQTLSLIHI